MFLNNENSLKNFNERGLLKSIDQDREKYCFLRILIGFDRNIFIRSMMRHLPSEELNNIRFGKIKLWWWLYVMNLIQDQLDYKYTIVSCENNNYSQVGKYGNGNNIFVLLDKNHMVKINPVICNDTIKIQENYYIA